MPRTRSQAVEEGEQSFFNRVDAFIRHSILFDKTVHAAIGEDRFWPRSEWPPVPEGGWEARIQQMLEEGFYPNGASVEFDNDQLTPLHLAVEHNNEPLCRILLSHGANANLCSTFGDSGGDGPARPSSLPAGRPREPAPESSLLGRSRP